jgi:hypothetical protein
LSLVVTMVVKVRLLRPQVEERIIAPLLTLLVGFLCCYVTGPITLSVDPNMPET